MKKIKFVHSFFTLGMRTMLLIASLFIATSTHAGIINADFSQGADGLDDWLGDIVIDDGVSCCTFDSGDITDLYPGLFSSNGSGAATIQTGAVPAGEAFIVTLFQEFVLDPIALGSSLFVSVNLADAADDFTALLFNLDTGEDRSLTNGVASDITSWVGATVSLEFTVEDFDGLLGDSLTISNILFEERLSVPEPPLIFVVLIIALILIRNARLTR